MRTLPNDLKYTKEHEWVKLLEDGVAIVGITDYAQESLGDITFVELPQVGQSLEEGAPFGVVESVKAASDLFSPVAGEVLEVNDRLDGEPELLNHSPYEEGWVIKLKLTTEGDHSGLLLAEDYQKLLTS